jgi:hypothetical protein
MEEDEEVIPVTLYKVDLNKGGYDTNGKYWGTGQRLYYYHFESKDLTYIVSHIRAENRNQAKRIVESFHPQYKFSFKKHFRDND